MEANVLIITHMQNAKSDQVGVRIGNFELIPFNSVNGRFVWGIVTLDIIINQAWLKNPQILST